MPFYEKGDVRIHYEEVGSGFPLLVIPGGGLNSTVAGLATHPFNPFDEFTDEYHVIAADLRNAKGGQSTGPLEVDRPQWVICGCTGPSAARQVNLNKRTPAPGTRAGLPSDPSPSDRMTMCWTCSVDAFRRGFRPAARTTHRRSCGLG